MIKAKKSAFTLIELLAAMSVLAIIVLFTTRVYNSTTKSFNNAGKSNDINMRARAALAYIANEVSQTVLDAPNKPGPFCSVNVETGVGDNNSDALYVLSMVEEPDGTGNDENRSVNLVCYYMSNNKLMRRAAVTDTTINGMYDQDVWTVNKLGAGELINNVWYFRVDAYDWKIGDYLDTQNTGGQSLSSYIFDFSFINLYVEILDDDTFQRAKLLDSNGHAVAANSLVNTHKKVFTKKIFFNNLQGYCLQ